MKFSIIIPMYNVEKYIERCILSCCNQNIAILEYEIIVVNDGSPDRSLEIATNFEQKFSNIKIISQENQGLSVARNNGLKVAKGEYIWFVDSDDWIERNCLLDLYKKCSEFSLDVLSFEANDCDGEICVKRESFKDYNEFPIDGKSYLLSGKIVFPVCFKIFRRDFLLNNNLFFMKDIMHEDNEFVPRMFYLSKAIMKIDFVPYNVFQNSASITRSVNPKKSFDLIKVAQSYVIFMNEKGMSKDLKLQFSNYIGLAINSALNNSKLMNKVNKDIFYLELKRNKFLFRQMKRSSNLKYKFEAQLFLLSPNLFKILYSIFT